MDETQANGLAKLYGKRLRFTGVFERYGNRFDYYNRSRQTLLLGDICEEGSSEVLSPHVWIQDASLFADLEKGDKVSFEATVDRYNKPLKEEGPNKYVVAYNLNRPSDVSIVSVPALRVRPEPPAQPKPAQPKYAEPPTEAKMQVAAKPETTSDPSQLIALVQRTADECGGWDKLKMLVNLLAR